MVYHLLQQILSGSKPFKATDKQEEMYGLRHILLNIQLPPSTLWFNMGLWTDNVSSFSDACSKLVLETAKYTRIQNGNSVLDVGFGCGDSCLLLADQYNCNVTGITNELTQVQMANERLTDDQKQKITLLHGSADDLDRLFPKHKFDHILSIDSAYHYDTRWDFFKNAYNLLNDKGTLGLFDFALDPTFSQELKKSSWKLFLFKTICTISKVPAENLMSTPTEYKHKLHQAGFNHICLETVEQEKVFGGISRFMTHQLQNTAKYGVNIGITDKLFLRASCFVFHLLATNKWIVPLMVSAEKQA
ncbi:hypothetical protein RMATCC62417_08328 [Rhizopus microsporus]|nr:hypothetical protein RMATCC62417_08328 [Rhizopus microsporus]